MRYVDALILNEAKIPVEAAQARLDYAKEVFGDAWAELEPHIQLRGYDVAPFKGADTFGTVLYVDAPALRLSPFFILLNGGRNDNLGCSAYLEASFRDWLRLPVVKKDDHSELQHFLSLARTDFEAKESQND